MDLDEDEREALAFELLRSVRRERPEDVERAWARTIEQRLEAIERGEVELVDGEAVHDQIRARLESMRR